MKKILKAFYAMTKYIFYSIIIQCSLASILIAAESVKSQRLEKVEISISEENISLKEIFSIIEKQTEFKFTYLNKNIPVNEKTTLDPKKVNLKSILTQIAYDHNLEFKRINRQIMVRRSKSKKQKVQEIIIDQERIVSGVVTDGNVGEPLPGVTVLVKGTNIGTITDVNGNYKVSLPPNAEALLFSFVGYATIEREIGNQTEINIALLFEESQLDEIVVIGYGTQEKSKFNGAVSKIDNQKLNNFSSANFEQAIAGNLAGVQISGNGKNPGDNSVIQIRGLSTLTAGSNPLIVVDGNPLTEGSSLSSINTQDIASIDVLKDAASAAIYGSRASNGVILITTKKGKESKLKVTYDGYVGFQQRIDNFELADAYQTALFDNDARNFGYVSGGTERSVTDDNATRDANGGGKRSRVQPFLQDYINGTPGLTNTDWADAIFRTAPQQNHYLNLKGGSSNTDYSISFNYFDQDNIVIESGYKRYISNIQLNSKIREKVRFGISSNVSYADANPTGEAGWSDYGLNAGNQPDPAFSIILMQPYYPIYNPDGSLAIDNQINDNNDNWDGPISGNSVSQVKLSDFTRNSFRVFGNAYVEIEPITGLKFKTSFGGDYNTDLEEFFAPSILGDYRTPVENNLTQASREDRKRENFITENLLTYSKAFGKHAFNVLLGYSYQQEFFNRVRITSNDFTDDNLRNVSGATSSIALPTSSKWALESMFSRLQYDYDNRYSFSASFRRDGSSRFGANTKYGNFSSLSAGWTLSNEAFFPQEGLVSFAKLRVSWGQTGNNQIGNFASIALIDQDNYLDNGSLVAGAYTRTSPNADLSWETNTSTNFGVDLGFLDNKILLTAEYYTSNTTDLLLEVPVPQQSGFSNSLQNIGELDNSGFELELSGNGFQIGELTLGFNANLFTNRNEVVALGSGQTQILTSNGGMGFLTKVGESVSQFYAYDIIGVYRSQSELDNETITPLPGTEVGDYIVRDVNNDGEITPDDRTPLGDYNPEFTYGFGFSVAYKGFDLGIQFNGVEGRKAADRMVYFAESGEGFFVPSQYYMDNYFSDRNPSGFFRRPDFSSFSSAGRLTRASSLSVLDADYFRLRSLQLGYTFPSNMLSHLSIERLRVYITGNNIFNLSDFRGYNPDGIDTRNNRTQTLTRGWIQSASPLTRFLALGVNIQF